MNGSALVTLMNWWHEDKIALQERKGHDYASDEDRFGNFRRLHKLCKILDIRPAERQEDVFLFYVLLKLDRLCNLLHARKKPKNEPVGDTLQDQSVYLDLLRAYLWERDAASDAQVALAKGVEVTARVGEPHIQSLHCFGKQEEDDGTT